jgi:hypothetical protein
MSLRVDITLDTDALHGRGGAATRAPRERQGEASRGRTRLAAEAVEGAALALEGVHDIESSDGLTTSVLSVGDGVTDDVLEEDLEDTAGLLVDEARDTLDTTTTSETTDGGLLQRS